MAGRFDVHAQTVEDEARKMWASSQNIAGAGWSGTPISSTGHELPHVYYCKARVNHRMVSQEAGGAAGVVARWSYAPPVTTQCQLLVALRPRGSAAPYR